MSLYNFWGILVAPAFMALCLKRLKLLEISYKEVFLYYIILAGSSYLCAYKISIEYPLIYIMLLILMGMTLIHRHFIRSFILCLVSSAFYILSEALAAIILLLFLGKNPYSSSIYFLSLGLVFSSIILWSLSGLVGRIIGRIHVEIFDNKITYFITLNLMIMLGIVYIDNMTSTRLGVKQNDSYVLISGVLYFLYFITSILLFIIILKYMLKEQEIKQQEQLTEAKEKYVKEIETSYDSLRRLKHDYVNIISAFKIYIDEEDIQGLKKYYYEEFSQLNTELLKQNEWLNALQGIKLSEIKSILFYKSSMAYEKNIKVTIEIREEISCIGMSTAILGQILGILLDNAIEASELAPKKDIDIAVIKNEKSQIFMIQNTYEGTLPSINRIFEHGFTTKKENRGIGLVTVRDYADKINNLYLDTQISETHFKQILVIKESPC